MEKISRFDIRTLSLVSTLSFPCSPFFDDEAKQVFVMKRVKLWDVTTLVGTSGTSTTKTVPLGRPSNIYKKEKFPPRRICMRLLQSLVSVYYQTYYQMKRDP